MPSFTVNRNAISQKQATRPARQAVAPPLTSLVWASGSVASDPCATKYLEFLASKPQYQGRGYTNGGVPDNDAALNAFYSDFPACLLWASQAQAQRIAYLAAHSPPPANVAPPGDCTTPAPMVMPTGGGAMRPISPAEVATWNATHPNCPQLPLDYGPVQPPVPQPPIVQTQPVVQQGLSAGQVIFGGLLLAGAVWWFASQQKEERPRSRSQSRSIESEE